MYILVDRQRMAVIYRCEKVETLRALANIEFAHTGVAILDETSTSAFRTFGVDSLQKLFEGLTNGTNPHSHNADYLVGQIMRLCQSAPPTAVDDFNVALQSLQIKQTDKNDYRYRKGEPRPERLTEAYLPPALVGNWKAAQGLPLPTVQTSAPAPAQAPRQPQPWAVAPAATPPKYAPPWA